MEHLYGSRYQPGHKCQRCGRWVQEGPCGCGGDRPRISGPEDPEWTRWKEELAEPIYGFLTGTYSEDRLRMDLMQAQLSEEDIAETLESVRGIFPQELETLRRYAKSSADYNFIGNTLCSIHMAVQNARFDTPAEKAWYRDLAALFDGFILGKCSAKHVRQAINELPSLAGFLQDHADAQVRCVVEEKLRADLADKVLTELAAELRRKPGIWPTLPGWEECQRRRYLRAVARLQIFDILRGMPTPEKKLALLVGPTQSKRPWWKFWG
jgi:hypothetical protein